jgi:alkylation response protein AidB-like acyl-CoA dehydrogenase
VTASLPAPSGAPRGQEAVDEAEGSSSDDEHAAFREVVRTFVRREVAPFDEEWESTGCIGRALFQKAGAQGLLLPQAPTRFGGLGLDDWRFSAIVDEELARAGFASAGVAIALQNDVAGAYFLHVADEGQQARWLPGLVSGELVAAVAMTEPGTGSDLAGIATRATRVGDSYIVNGAKTFITNGQNADLVVVVARTAPDPHRGLTLLVIERGMPGFDRGRNLDKLGLHGQDTSELSFTDVRVPVRNRLGAENEGFFHLAKNLSQERLSLAVSAVAASQGVLEKTLAYVKARHAFGQSIGSFQHSRFLLAELTTDVEIAKVFVDDCVSNHVRHQLTAVRAAMAKYWCTELQVRVADRCLQLHGGYGYMREYAVSRAFADARVQTIFGGTTEIMKEIIGRDLGL